MTSRQENIFTMWKNVREHLLKNQALWGGISAATTRFTKFTQIYDGVLPLYQQQAHKTKGHSQLKKQKREIAIQTAINIAAVLRLYAHDTNDLPLLAEVNWRKSHLSQLADLELHDVLQTISDSITQISNAGTNLADYNISAQDLSDFQAQIDAYNQSISAPRLVSIQTAIATRELKQQFDQGNELLKEFDDLLKTFSSSQAKFYQEYQKARTVIEYGTHHTGIEIEVIVFSQDTGKNDLLKATIILTSPLHNYVLNTDSSNKATLKPIPRGDYQVHIEAEGYEAQDLTLHITSGKNNRIQIQLQAA